MLLCIDMHRESGSDSEVDPIVKLIWSKVLHHNFYRNFYYKFDHNCGLGAQEKLLRRTQHYPRWIGAELNVCVHGWIWAASWKVIARWQAIARCTQVRQVQAGPLSSVAVVGSLSKLLYRCTCVHVYIYEFIRGPSTPYV